MNVTTEEELVAFLAGCKDQGWEEVNIYATEALYNTLSENKFAYMNRLCYENDMKKFSLWYYESSFRIKLTSITYAETHMYAYVTSQDEADAAIAGFLSNGLTAFNIGCDDAMYESLLTEKGIYTTMAMAGAYDFYMMYGSNTLEIYDVTLFDGPWKAVTDVYSAADQIGIWHEEGLTKFNLVFGKKIYDTLSDTDKTLIDFLGGIDRANSRPNSYSGSISYGYYSDVTWAEGQSVYCPTEDDIVTAIRVLGAQGATSFRVMTTDELYAVLNENSFARLHELEAQAGMTSSSMSYYFSLPIVMYSDAVIAADVVQINSLDEVNAYVAECVDRQDTEINLFLSADVYNDLMSGVSWIMVGKSDAKIFDLIANSGIANASWSYSRDTHIITLKDVELYAGTRILQATEKGSESALNERDHATLAEARAIADACAGMSDLEKLKYIHDVLCERIVYTDDENTDEDDCAIGAIMTGEANCDGYADALYLIGHLAGLDVRYQHGDSVKQGLGSMFATHMWNVVLIDGTWRLVDVTWDDQKDGAPIYAWFNIGEDRASLTHVWSREMTVAMDPVTDVSARIDPEYTVTTEEDIRTAAADADAKGYATYYLYVTDGSELDQSAVRHTIWDAVSGSFTYMWLDGLNGMLISR